MDTGYIQYQFNDTLSMYDVLRNINISNIIFHTDFLKFLIIITIYSFICMYVCICVCVFMWEFLCHCACLSVRGYFTGISLSFHNVSTRSNVFTYSTILPIPFLFSWRLINLIKSLVFFLKKVTTRGKNKREGRLREYSEITATMYLGSQSRTQTRVHKLGQLRASRG